MSLFRCFLWPIVLLAFLLCSLNIASVTVFEHWNRGAFPSTPITATRASTSQQDETDDSTALLKAYPSDKWEPVPRPPLLSIVQGWNISGDASWLLQFSIVGFPKCGTSTLMFHLRSHSQVQMFQDERCELGSNQHARLIQDLYRQFPPLPSTADAENLKPRFVRGIKCPSDLETTKLSMRNYRTVFPRTDFVVGVRHPVLWYVSVFYWL